MLEIHTSDLPKNYPKCAWLYASRKIMSPNSPRTIHHGKIHRTQITAQNSPRKIHRAQSTAAYNSSLAQFIAHTSPRKIKNSAK
jgi:hypothetical protein